MSLSRIACQDLILMRQGSRESHWRFVLKRECLNRNWSWRLLRQIQTRYRCSISKLRRYEVWAWLRFQSSSVHLGMPEHSLRKRRYLSVAEPLTSSIPLKTVSKSIFSQARVRSWVEWDAQGKTTEFDLTPRWIRFTYLEGTSGTF
jgi:hypothetical protein